jgi:hypothetical protein
MHEPRLLKATPLFTKRAFASARQSLARTESLQRILREIEDNVGLSGLNREELKALSSSHPEAFARRFMIKNMIKCAIATEYYRSEIRVARRIIDLGTGPGTFLIPFASMVKNAEFVGIDRSRSALHLANRLFRLAEIPPPLLIHGLVPGSVASGGRLFTASYLAAEFEPDELAAFGRWIGTRQDATFLIVDYPDVVLRLAQHISHYRDCNVKAFQFKLPPDIAGAIDDDQISFGTAFTTIS